MFLLLFLLGGEEGGVVLSVVKGGAEGFELIDTTLGPGKLFTVHEPELDRMLLVGDPLVGQVHEIEQSESRLVSFCDQLLFVFDLDTINVVLINTKRWVCVLSFICCGRWIIVELEGDFRVFDDFDGRAERIVGEDERKWRRKSCALRFLLRYPVREDVPVVMAVLRVPGGLDKMVGERQRTRSENEVEEEPVEGVRVFEGTGQSDEGVDNRVRVEDMIFGPVDRNTLVERKRGERKDQRSDMLFDEMLLHEAMKDLKQNGCGDDKISNGRVGVLG